MSGGPLLKICDDLSAAIDIAEAIGFIADGISAHNEEAGGATSVVATILVDRLKKMAVDLNALREEVAE